MFSTSSSHHSVCRYRGQHVTIHGTLHSASHMTNWLMVRARVQFRSHASVECFEVWSKFKVTRYKSWLTAATPLRGRTAGHRRPHRPQKCSNLKVSLIYLHGDAWHRMQTWIWYLFVSIHKVDHLASLLSPKVKIHILHRVPKVHSPSMINFVILPKPKIHFMVGSSLPTARVIVPKRPCSRWKMT